MPPEILALALSALLLAAQLAGLAVRGNLEMGPAYFASPRDTPLPKPPSVLLGRMQRAYHNHIEALVLFAVAVLVVTLTDKASPVTAALAWVYLAARLAFVPAYLLGWVPWRSAIWGIGWIATLAMLIFAVV